MRYNEKSDMPSMYSERYGITYAEVRREDEWVYIDIPIDEYIADDNSIRITADILRNVLRAEPADICFIDDDTMESNSLLKLELALVDHYMKKSDEKHYSKKVRNFYKKYGMKINGYIPALKYSDNGSCTIVPEINEEKISVVRTFSFEYLCEVCELYREFSDGVKLSIDDLYLIASNIRTVANGKRKFLEKVINADIEWKGIFASFRKSNMQRISCDKCRYRDKCDHSDDMITTAKPENNHIIRLKEEEYCTLGEAEYDLYSNFVSAIESNDEDMHIIKAQTSLGKTRMIIDYIKQNPDKKFIISAPTHKLKNQIYKDAKDSGITNIFNTPDIKEYPISKEIMEQVDKYYRIGAGMKVLPFLKKVRSKIHKDSLDYKCIDEYLKDCETAKTFDGNIVTSHSRFLYMNSEQFENYQIIIDEDIMRTLLAIDMISVDELKRIKSELKLPEEVVSKIDYLCSCKPSDTKTYYTQCRSINNSENIFSEITDFDKVDVNLYGLIKAEYFAVDNNYVHFLDEKYLPKRKLIIMSATVDSELYKKIYPYRKIHFYECRKAEYTGKVIQYTDYSYSRYSFEENENLIDELKKKVGEQVIITLKCIENQFETKYHFGNVEGLNDNKGKNIAVIGLPNLNEVVYGLYGIRMGADDSDIHMCCRRIQYNNFYFRLNTFENPIIRRIQLWILSSYLEQAVGRARLLRENCIVTVFSGFPVEQAEFFNNYDD